MERLKLEVSARDGRGKSATRKLRAQDKVPGIVYGSGIEPTPVSAERIALARVLRGGANALVDLSGAKSLEGKPVLVKEVQRDPLSRKHVHFDLYAPNLQERLDVEVPIHFVGTPRGVAVDAGVIEILLRTLEVSCMPLAIPESIDVDVSNLGIGDAIHVRDIALPPDVVSKIEADTTVVHVVAPRLEEEPVAAAAPAEGEVAPAEGEAAPAAGEAAAADKKAEKAEE
jgi:large subunit ribosomal protein L25